jgi:hypothetical protein
LSCQCSLLKNTRFKEYKGPSQKLYLVLFRWCCVTIICHQNSFKNMVFLI